MRTCSCSTTATTECKPSANEQNVLASDCDEVSNRIYGNATDRKAPNGGSQQFTRRQVQGVERARVDDSHVRHFNAMACRWVGMKRPLPIPVLEISDE